MLYNNELFNTGTELQRPKPWHQVEKNFFLFWDKDNNMYIHNDVAPRRVYAKLNADGSVGSDLWAARPPRATPSAWPSTSPRPWGSSSPSTRRPTPSPSRCAGERIRTASPTTPTPFSLPSSSTKMHYGSHSTYEPYVMMFQRRAPFELYAVSTKPMWIHGRKASNSAMFYVTSMSWKAHDAKYHGYLDDEMFWASASEDKSTSEWTCSPATY